MKKFIVPLIIIALLAMGCLGPQTENGSKSSVHCEQTKVQCESVCDADYQGRYSSCMGMCDGKPFGDDRTICEGSCNSQEGVHRSTCDSECEDGFQGCLNS
jgi:hypothetical protein